MLLGICMGRRASLATTLKRKASIILTSNPSLHDFGQIWRLIAVQTVQGMEESMWDLTINILLIWAGPIRG